MSKNDNVLYCVTGLSFFWGPKLNEETAEKITDLACYAMQNDIDNIGIAETLFEITAESTEENIFSQANEVNKRNTCIKEYGPYGDPSEDCVENYANVPVLRCIDIMKKKAEHVSETCDGKVVEIDGKKYTLNLLDEG